MDDLKHIGTPRHSGRYPWGSGKSPEQRNKSFLGYVHDLRKQGLSEVEIAESFKLSTSELRKRKSIEKLEQRKADSATALRLKEKGYSNVAIGKRMGINESSVRGLLDPVLQERFNIASKTSNILRDAVEEKRYIDVGLGVEQHLGISRTKLNTAIAMLEEEGYKIRKIDVEQLGTGKRTTIKVLVPSDVTDSEIYKNTDKIKMVTDYSEDGGRNFLGLEPVRNVDSKRIQVRYGDEGGSDKDGVIELRRGVDDISLGNAKYAQVRIGLDGTHYMKGMAMYSDDLPDGVDIIYNSKKPKGSEKDTVFKPIENDPDNPFGSVVRQKHYIDSNGKTQLSTLNIINEEGTWSTYSRNLSSQVLSKQSTSLAKKQLGLVIDLKNDEFNELTTLTNPAVKKRLLDSFADDCDSEAVHLKAAALPRQGWHVLLPFNSIRENEIYAPNFNNEETVVLIRHPHGGTFEIPELTVNNRNAEAKRIIGGASDAVGIHPKVASKLSGADFDGDDVIVIPNKNKDIRTSSSLRGLKDFDPREAYPGYKGMVHKITEDNKQQKMGDISNLITDMTIKGANEDEIARAVRHSMVVIDAEKHNLNYKQSYIDNNVANLKTKYQGGPRSGASTLISRANSDIRVDYRKDRGVTVTKRNTDPKTGKKIYEYTDETYTNAQGKVIKRKTLSKKLAEVEDAFELSSGTKMETVYADHANALKSLANRARKASLEIQDTIYSPSARVTYRKEVDVLDAKLNLAFRNKPLERQAQLLANKIVSSKRNENPGMKKKDLKKIKGQALEEARTRRGAKKQNIVITDREWEAIQAGAVSKNRLHQMLLNTDVASLKERALPRAHKTMSVSKVFRGRSMLLSGYTRAEVASALGVSVSTLDKALE